MARFKTSNEMMHSFNLYMNSRPMMLIYKNKFDQYVPSPPSIIAWSRWLKNDQMADDPNYDYWKKIKLKDLMLMGESKKFKDTWDEIQLIIEQDIISNGLVYNYNGNFATKVLIEKHGWENDVKATNEPVVFVGMDAVAQLLPKEPTDAETD